MDICFGDVFSNRNDARFGMTFGFAWDLGLLIVCFLLQGREVRCAFLLCLGIGFGYVLNSIFFIFAPASE